MLTNVTLKRIVNSTYMTEFWFRNILFNLICLQCLVQNLWLLTVSLMTWKIILLYIFLLVFTRWSHLTSSDFSKHAAIRWENYFFLFFRNTRIPHESFLYHLDIIVVLIFMTLVILSFVIVYLTLFIIT